MKTIEEELGSPVESVFGYISEEPVAAASFGQVDTFTELLKENNLSSNCMNTSINEYVL